MAHPSATRGVSAAFSVLLCLGCQEATQVTVDLRTDALCDGDPSVDDVFETASFFVTTADQVESDASGPPDADTQPGQCTAAEPLREIGTLGLLPGTDDDGSLGLQVFVGIDGISGEECASDPCNDSCIDIRRRVGFVPHRSLRLPITASRNCLGACCTNPTDTCVDGACVPIDEAPNCDPERESCDNPEPSEPDDRERFALTLARRGLEDVTAVAAHALGPREILVSMGGRFDGNSAALGSHMLSNAGGEGAFIATLTIDLDAPSTERLQVLVCQGKNVEVRDISLDDSGLTALLSGQEEVDCRIASSSNAVVSATLGSGAKPFVVDLGIADNDESLRLTPILATTSASAEGHGILRLPRQPGLDTPPFRATGSYASPTPTFVGAGLGPLTEGQMLYGLHHDGETPSLDPLFGSYGAIQTGLIEEAKAHYPVASGADLWHVGWFTGAYGSLGSTNDDLGSFLFATLDGTLSSRQAVSGRIEEVHRPRWVRGASSVIVPLRAAPNPNDDLLIGATSLALTGRSALAVSFGAMTSDLAVGPIAGATNPRAGGTTDGLCLGYDLDGAGHVRCQGPDGEGVETLGDETAEIEMRGLDMLLVPGTVDGEESWVVAVGFSNGALDPAYGAPMTTPGDEGQLFVASFLQD